MLRRIPFFIAALFSTLSIIGGQNSVAAEDPSPRQRIDAADVLLVQLDNLANSCLQSEENKSTSETSDTSEPSTLNNADSSPCTTFMEAIDGGILGSYLQHCKVLKSWRDEYVASSIAADNEAEQSEENLRLMVGIEYSCGENALLKRAQFVAQAFELANQRQTLLQSLNTGIRQQLRELELQNRLSGDRRSLLRDVEQEHRRQLLQTQDQFLRLENELIRQQINRPRY